MATSTNITKLKNWINHYFHNTYLLKFPLKIQDMLIHLFNDGKRIRPILFIAFNHIINLVELDVKVDTETINKNTYIWIEYAIDIELLHCLSLIIDDLPDMDNETERRGKPCFHLVYGMQKTNFFLYYMFSKLSNNLTHLSTFYNKNYSSISHKLLDDSSFIIHFFINNLIDGQYIDITSSNSMVSNLHNMIDNNIKMAIQIILSIYNEDKPSLQTEKEKYNKINNEEEINNTILNNHILLNIKKTGTLFALPIITGFLFQLYKKNFKYTGNEIIHDDFYIPNTNNSGSCSNYTKLYLGDNNIINLILTWALILGFVFQSSDDFLDRESDSINSKPNICNIMSVEDNIKLLSKCTLFCRVMFEYIYKNTRLYWPDLVFDVKCINEIINLIESRYQS